jgi:EAL domain-containing protein (putative c-di-GMP-specific phosphodiesterase class I)
MYHFFDKEMNARATDRQLLEDQLRVALERHELLLHYQPRIDLKSGEINGAEALLRWQHPDRGLIEPPQFMSIAEDCGLMVEIGKWVLLQSCRQARTWQRAGTPPIGMSVNISSGEFRSEDLLHSVRLALQESGLQPHLLEIELTESVLMQHAELTVPLLQKLKAIGVRLAIDHFGIGYSTLNNLSQFPIDALKVDRSFVTEIDTGANNSPIIRAVINMGKSLKHRVIAEGVETARHVAVLQSHACDEGQGFYFGRPMPALQFAELLRTGITVAVQNLSMMSQNVVK